MPFTKENAAVLAAKAPRCEHCGKPALRGSRWCQKDGGRALKGIAHPNFIHGRHSNSLPVRLIEGYDQSRADRNYLVLRDELALIDARLNDAIAKVDTGESGENWKSLQSAVKAFREAEIKANAAQGSAKSAEYLADREAQMDSIISLVQAGMADYAAWGEVYKWLEARRKFAETETNNLVKSREMLTREQALLREAKYLDVIRRCVTDRDTLAAISREFDKLAVESRSAVAAAA